MTDYAIPDVSINFIIQNQCKCAYLGHKCPLDRPPRQLCEATTAEVHLNVGRAQASCLINESAQKQLSIHVELGEMAIERVWTAVEGGAAVAFESHCGDGDGKEVTVELIRELIDLFIWFV